MNCLFRMLSLGVGVQEFARTSSSSSTCHLAVSEDSQNSAASGIATRAILPSSSDFEMETHGTEVGVLAEH